MRNRQLPRQLVPVMPAVRSLVSYARKDMNKAKVGLMKKIKTEIDKGLPEIGKLLDKNGKITLNKVDQFLQNVVSSFEKLLENPFKKTMIQIQKSYQTIFYAPVIFPFRF